MDERQLPWDGLQVFLAAARGGSLARAADTLGLSAATVHRRLAQLERGYETRLFTRSTRGLELTESGQDLLRHASVIESEMFAAARSVSGRDARVSGRVRVATVDDLAVTVLMPILRDFSSRHPDIEIELAVGSDLTDLERRQADVAIRTGSRPADGDLVARRICGVAVALYGSREWVAGLREPPTLTTVGSYPLVRADAARSALAMERLLDRQVPAPAAVLRSDSMLARLAAVRDGVGLGLLPCFAADAEPRLQRLGPVQTEASAALWTLVHADLRRNQRVHKFVRHLQSALGELAPRFEGKSGPERRRAALSGRRSP